MKRHKARPGKETRDSERRQYSFTRQMFQILYWFLFDANEYLSFGSLWLVFYTGSNVYKIILSSLYFIIVHSFIHELQKLGMNSKILTWSLNSHMNCINKWVSINFILWHLSSGFSQCNKNVIQLLKGVENLFCKNLTKSMEKIYWQCFRYH